MKKIGILLLLLIVVNTAWSQATFWKSTNTSPTPNYGNANLSIAIGSTNSLFVGTVKDGIYKSTNNGDSWELSLACFDTAIIKILSRSNDELLAIGRNAVYRTTNNGQSWQKHILPTIYTIRDIEVLSDGKIIVSTADVIDVSGSYYDYFGDGIFISNDNGNNWVQSNNGIGFNKAITNIAVGPNDVLVASMASYLHNVGDLYYSLNKGADWIIMPKIKFYGNNGTTIYTPTSIYETHCLEIDSDGIIYFSFDGVDGNISVQGGFKNSIARAINNIPWLKNPINNLGFEWDFTPFHSIHFAKKQNHIYASLNTPGSVSRGGNYIQYGNDTVFKKKNSGIYPVMEGYLKLIYAEDDKGRIYTIQTYDHSVYYTDSSASNLSSIITKPKNNIEIGVYPNPARDVVNIKLVNSEDTLEEVLVSDLSGKIILEEYNINETHFLLNTSFLQHGVYILSIKSTSGITHQKLIIE